MKGKNVNLRARKLGGEKRGRLQEANKEIWSATSWLRIRPWSGKGWWQKHEEIRGLTVKNTHNGGRKGEGRQGSLPPLESPVLPGQKARGSRVTLTWARLRLPSACFHLLQLQINQLRNLQLLTPWAQQLWFSFWNTDSTQLKSIFQRRPRKIWAF